MGTASFPPPPDPLPEWDDWVKGHDKWRKGQDKIEPPKPIALVYRDPMVAFLAALGGTVAAIVALGMAVTAWGF